MSDVFEVAHPLIQHHLTRLRDVATVPVEFRQLVRRLSVLLAYEAAKDLEVQPQRVSTPLSSVTGHELCQRIGLIPLNECRGQGIGAGQDV